MVKGSMRPIQKGVLAGIVTISVYIGVVIATTPALDPLAAVDAAFRINSIVIIGMGIGIGLQVALSEKARMAGCAVGRRFLGGNSSGAATTSFFSFFSLVPLGCCGWWLYLLSLLPGVLGVGASAILIQYSQVLSYAALAAVFGFAALAAYRLRQATIARRSPIHE